MSFVSNNVQFTIHKWSKTITTDGMAMLDLTGRHLENESTTVFMVGGNKCVHTSLCVWQLEQESFLVYSERNATSATLRLFSSAFLGP